MDISQVLGLDYVALLKGLGHEGAYSHWYVAVNIHTQYRPTVTVRPKQTYVHRELPGRQCHPMVLYQPCRAEEM